jgi:hypothetical protein
MIIYLFFIYVLFIFFVFYLCFIYVLFYHIFFIVIYLSYLFYSILFIIFFFYCILFYYIFFIIFFLSYFFYHIFCYYSFAFFSIFFGSYSSINKNCLFVLKSILDKSLSLTISSNSVLNILRCSCVIFKSSKCSTSIFFYSLNLPKKPKLCSSSFCL